MGRWQETLPFGETKDVGGSRDLLLLLRRVLFLDFYDVWRRLSPMIFRHIRFLVLGRRAGLFQVHLLRVAGHLE